MFGWQGKALRVNLTNGLVETELIATELLEDYLGGCLLTGKIAELENISAENNKLVISNGVLTGTGTPGAALCAIGAHVFPEFFCCPLWYHLGAELKFCGYDVIIIEGEAPVWSYLLVSDNEVKIVSGEEIKGLSLRETENFIRDGYSKWLGNEIRILSIGEAGEGQSALASLVNDGLLISHSGGIGSVFGEKHLKAIAIRGTGDFKLAHASKFVDIITKAIQNFRDNKDRIYEQMANICEELNLPLVEKIYYGSEKRGCLGCPIACLQQKQEEFLPHFTTLFCLTHLLGLYRLEEILVIYHLCLKKGIDPIALSVAARCVIELVKQGKVKETSLKIGDIEGLINLITDHDSLLHKGAARLAQEYNIEEYFKGLKKELNEHLGIIFGNLNQVNEKMHILDALGICPYILLGFPFEMIKETFKTVTGKELDEGSLKNRGLKWMEDYTVFR